MRTPTPKPIYHVLRLLLVVAISLSLVACVEAAQDRPRITDIPPDAEQHYFAIEAKGTLCGYAHLVTYPKKIDGRDFTLLQQKTVVLMSVLGADVNTEIDQVYHIDPATGKYTYADFDVRQGPSRFSWEARIEEGTAHVNSTLGGGDKAIELPPDVLLSNTMYFPHLKRDFVDLGLVEKSYEMLEIRDAEVQEVVYTRVGTESVELAGNTYETVILDEWYPKTGIKLKLWIDIETGQVVQGDLPADRRFYLTEPRVVRKIEVANVTEDITSKVGVLISDFQSITYMKVRAVFQPTGLQLSPEALNVPGQTFTGTVEENRVEGVFEIEHARYDGAGAPPFPPDFTGDEALREYLEPGELIESDDPVLIEKARELTAGATDSWDAIGRLSSWVSQNISYAIPGGVSARRVYDQRAGECGGHSVLVAAMSRAVGIPARLVWGCQYIPNFGGAFGQHGWDEVYMGEAAGWVPLDSTSYEPDYVDSGHIRIGYYQSFATGLNPIEMEVLEYRLGDDDVVRPDLGDVPVATLSPESETKYGEYLAKYMGAGGRTFEVKVDNGSLVVYVDGEIVLPFNDPDAEGVWYCKLAPHLYATFDRDDSGRVTSMWFHEVVRMRKTAEPEEADSNVPEELRGHLGGYLLAQLNAEFTVAWRHGSLAIRDPGDGTFVRLEEDADEAGTWISQRTGNTITFQTDAEGKVEGLTLDSRGKLERR